MNRCIDWVRVGQNKAVGTLVTVEGEMLGSDLIDVVAAREALVVRARARARASLHVHPGGAAQPSTG